MGTVFEKVKYLILYLSLGHDFLNQMCIYILLLSKKKKSHLKVEMTASLDPSGLLRDLVIRVRI